LDAIFTVTDSILMADLCRPSRVSGSAAFFQNAARLADARGARRVRNPFCARLEQRVVALHRRRRRHYSFGRLVGRATELLSALTGSDIGGFLNATFRQRG
jgi:2-keto-3-deoxy-galactonokinase